MTRKKNFIYKLLTEKFKLPRNESFNLRSENSHSNKLEISNLRSWKQNTTRFGSTDDLANYYYKIRNYSHSKTLSSRPRAETTSSISNNFTEFQKLSVRPIKPPKSPELLEKLYSQSPYISLRGRSKTLPLETFEAQEIIEDNFNFQKQNKDENFNFVKDQTVSLSTLQPIPPPKPKYLKQESPQNNKENTDKPINPRFTLQFEQVLDSVDKLVNLLSLDVIEDNGSENNQIIPIDIPSHKNSNQEISETTIPIPPKKPAHIRFISDSQ